MLIKVVSSINGCGNKAAHSLKCFKAFYPLNRGNFFISSISGDIRYDMSHLTVKHFYSACSSFWEHKSNCQNISHTCSFKNDHSWTVCAAELKQKHLCDLFLTLNVFRHFLYFNGLSRNVIKNSFSTLWAVNKYDWKVHVSICYWNVQVYCIIDIRALWGEQIISLCSIQNTLSLNITLITLNTKTTSNISAINNIKTMKLLNEIPLMKIQSMNKKKTLITHKISQVTCLQWLSLVLWILTRCLTWWNWLYWYWCLSKFLFVRIRNSLSLVTAVAVKWAVVNMQLLASPA